MTTLHARRNRQPHAAVTARPLDRITQAFGRGQPAFMPYFTVGYPNYAASLDIVQAMAGAGADLIELGMPFSDPLADGPTIQHSTQVALQNGMTTARCLQAVRDLRARKISTPFMLMGYFNPLLAYGVEQFVEEAAAAGANGFIIPDLPPEEAGALESACRRRSLGLAYLLAPTSTDERIQRVAAAATGFVYLVSLAGVTGARAQLPPNLGAFVERVRAHTHTPVAVGFGISTPDQARAVGRLADGVIVGSKLIDVARAAENPAAACAVFVREMIAALRAEAPPA